MFTFPKPNTTSYTILVGICSVVVTFFGVYLFVNAGNIDSPAIPATDTGRMYTLDQIYHTLYSGTVPTKQSGGFTEPGSAPGSTMHTLDDIYDDFITDVTATNGTTAGDVRSGKTFFATSGTTRGTNWGPVAGTMSAGVAGGTLATGQTVTAPTANYQINDDGTYQSGLALSYTDNNDGTITDNNTGLMWIKQPELVIPGATGVTATNQIPNTDSNGDLVTKGDWATSTNYYVRDLVRATLVPAGTYTFSRAAKVVTANSAVFTSADIGREIWNDTTSASMGIVTNYVSSTVVWVTGSGTVTAGARLAVKSLYYCTTAHTSGTFATDLSAGNWRESPTWATSIAYLAGDIAFAQQRDAGVNATQSATTVTAASGTPFTSADIGRNLFIGTANAGVIRVVTSSTVVTVTISQTISTPANMTIYSNYVCATAHTSGTFADDLSAGNWRETLWSNSTKNLTTLLATTTAATLAMPVAMRWDTQAIVNCEGLVYGGTGAGYTDWRLPNQNELLSIVNYSVFSPVITTAKFPNTQSGNYCSSTTSAGGTTDVWVVHFNYGLMSYSIKTSIYYVRCVR